MRRRALIISAFLAACNGSGNSDVSSSVKSCVIDDVAPACSAAPQAMTSAATEETAPAVEAGVTYAISGPSPGAKSFVVFTATTSGVHTFYFGGEAPIRVCDEEPTCSGALQGCPTLHRAAQYDLVIGEHYEIELRPIAPGHPFTLHIVAPASAPSSGVKLAAAQTYAAGTTPYYLETGDLDGDQALDLVVSTPDDASGMTTVDLLQGSGTGAFALVNQVTTSAPGETVVSDFSGDGTADIVGVAFDGQGPLPAFYLQGQGGFRYATSTWGDGRDFQPRLSGGDFDEDGTLDVVATYADSSESTDVGGFAIVIVPGFTALDDEAVFGPATRQAIAGDFNGDGHQDVVVASRTTGNVRLYLGDGTGAVTFDSELALPGDGTLQIAAFDLDRDGASDLVALHAGALPTVSYGGAAGFSAPTTFAELSSFASGIAAGDFDHDGRLDLAIGHLESDTPIDVFLASDTGFTLGGTLEVPNGSPTRDLVAADFNGDGLDDLAATNLGAVAVYLSTP
jgi:hypothetical protein